MSNQLINSNRQPEPQSDSSSRASQFAPHHNLGQQRPDRAQRFGRHAWMIGAYLVALGLLLLRGTSPELWLQSVLGLDPAPLPTSPFNAALLAGAALLVVAIGASYKPLGGLLGFGALPLPTLAIISDASITSLTCCLGSGLAAIILRSLSKRDPHAPRDRRGNHRIFLDATNTGIATLIAAVTWTTLAGTNTVAAMTASTVIWLVVSQTLDRTQHRSRRRLLGRRASRFGVLWDALGWVLAASLAVISASAGLLAAVPLLIGFMALIVVGSSRELDRTLHLRRIRDLQHLGSMAQRLVPTEQASELAIQCLDEVRRTVDFTYFELRFESSGGSEVFSSRAHGPLLVGTQEVPAHPAAAPGIHTRRSWILIERDLLSRPVSAANSSTAHPSTQEPAQRLGKLRLWIDPRNQSDNDEELIHDLVPQIAALIDRSRLDREARQDALTGLARRHVFDRELERRFELAREDGHSVALLLFDLDHFKQVNDNYGHDAGDRVLEAIGAILLRAAEPGGLACRWGGEELALLQWGGGNNALQFADQLRAFIAEQLIQTDSGPLSVTTSVGVAAFPDLLLQEPEDLVKLADEALYAAKERGRNRALLANGRARFRGANGELVGALAGLDPELIPQL